MRVVQELRRRGIPVAVITSSRNSEEVLASAGVRDLFAVKGGRKRLRRDGIGGKAHAGHIPRGGPPSRGVSQRTAIVEDALSGVEAGRRGGFGLVVGVDRGDQPEDLAASGADIVVSDLGELLVGE